MVIQVKEIKPRRSFFMTDEEAKILWEESKRWSSKFRLILAFALFRGLRIGEILAINLLDFNHDFTALNVIIEKSHILETLPLVPQLTAMVKDYVLKNRHLMIDGYLFPYYTSRKAPHMRTATAEALFSKLRKIIGKKHPQFLECYTYPSGYKKYRIGLHSCRRWFETRIFNNIGNKTAVADIMRYLDRSTVDKYLDPYETQKQ